MNNHADDTFACDLETRLEDFFEGTPPPDDMPPEMVEPPSADETKNDILKGLKSSVLSIDWEITDDGLNDFIKRAEELKTTFEEDKINSTLLKMLTSLGKYLLKHKSMAHPETINRIMTVYTAIEESVTDGSLSSKEKERLLMDEVKQFKQFKAQITKTAPSKTSTASGIRQPLNKTTPCTEDVLKAIDDLRSLMASELSAIRMEIEKMGNR